MFNKKVTYLVFSHHKSITSVIPIMPTKNQSMEIEEQ